ncbi:MAG TPA: hypothetical protein VGL62_00450 [Vicinamibacterales bacterium]|jgi:hypothetical protein
MHVQNVPAAAPRRSIAGVVVRMFLHLCSLLVGIAAYVAHEHFALAGNSTASLVSLILAGVFGLSFVRAVLHEFFAIEGRVLHVVHGLSALSLIGLTATGTVSGGPLLSHAALAPFSIMGAAQALMHQNHPRNAAQAAALQRFATSLPEVEVFAKPGDLTSPATAARAVSVLNDLIGKAQALGETELQADPQFQSALQAVGTHVGLSLGLDAIDRAIGSLANNPATAGAVPGLRQRLADAR